MRLHVPKRLPPEDHNLIDIVGEATALKLVERFGGMDHFDIPKAEAIRIHCAMPRFAKNGHPWASAS